MKYSIRELILVINTICLCFGFYSLGDHFGSKQGRFKGYAEARDHYQVMLSSYAEKKEVWDHIGDLWRNYPKLQIIGEPFDTDREWKWYVNYHSKRNPWLHPNVFQTLVDDMNKRSDQIIH